MRIGIAGFMHESNTFTGELTELRHFQEAFLHYGRDLIPIWEDAHHELGGFIAGCREHDVEMAPLLAAWATPKGPVTDEAYETILAELLERLRAAAPLDGLLLALHGAMVSQSQLSADTETLRRVREALGPDIPLILSLDMHGNITPEMAALPNATIVYRTYPHVDQRERGIECAALLARIVRGEVRPVQAYRKLPLLMHIVQQYTGAGPLFEIFQEVERITQLPGILSASVAPGYIYADTPHMGVSVIVAADQDPTLAEEHADKLAGFIIKRREALNATLPDVPTAVARAATLPGTVCLMDCGDNIGGGGPGDSTIIFAELLRQGLPRVCVVLYDPEAAAYCARAWTGAGCGRPARTGGDTAACSSAKAGAGGCGRDAHTPEAASARAWNGAAVELSVGGKTDTLHGEPVPLRGTVIAVADGAFTEPEPRHGGTRVYNQGLSAVVATDDGHTVVLNSLRVMPTSLQQLLSLGIDPAAHRVIVVKGVTAPRAAYEPIASAVIPVDSPGVTQAGPEAFGYQRRPRPLYPLDE